MLNKNSSFDKFWLVQWTLIAMMPQVEIELAGVKIMFGITANILQSPPTCIFYLFWY